MFQDRGAQTLRGNGMEWNGNEGALYREQETSGTNSTTMKTELINRLNCPLLNIFNACDGTILVCDEQRERPSCC